MSNKISGRVWELELDPIDKLVLLALSDHADHNGDNVRPGNELLVAKTGLTEKTVSAKIAKFIEDGILEPVKVDTGRGHKRQFSMATEHIPRRKYFIEKDKKKAERASTFSDRKRANPLLPFKSEKAVTGSTFKNQKVEADDRKVVTDAGKVVTDAKAQDLPLMERARAMNPHEPSIESCISAQSAAAPQRADKDHPAIVFLRSLTNRYPDKSLWPQIADLLGEKFDEQKLRACYTTWVARGWNKVNFTWLFEWYLDGIPDLRNSSLRQGQSQKQINAANTPHNEFIDHCVREFEAEQSNRPRQASEEIIDGELIP